MDLATRNNWLNSGEICVQTYSGECLPICLKLKKKQFTSTCMAQSDMVAVCILRVHPSLSRLHTCNTSCLPVPCRRRRHTPDHRCWEFLRSQTGDNERSRRDLMPGHVNSTVNFEHRVNSSKLLSYPPRYNIILWRPHTHTHTHTYIQSILYHQRFIHHH